MVGWLIMQVLMVPISIPIVFPYPPLSLLSPPPKYQFTLPESPESPESQKSPESLFLYIVFDNEQFIVGTRRFDVGTMVTGGGTF